jgi:hypothetical protein
LNSRELSHDSCNLAVGRFKRRSAVAGLLTCPLERNNSLVNRQTKLAIELAERFDERWVQSLKHEAMIGCALTARDVF